jgi:tRNA modification GTPase
VQRADLAIVVLDARDPEGGRNAVADAIAQVPMRLWLHNKADLLGPDVAVALPHAQGLRVSARTGQGLEQLHAALREHATGGQVMTGTFTARARHVEALRRAHENVGLAGQELAGEALDLAAEQLRLAHEALGEITGRVTPNDLLGHIFASFCIGK